jgi:hypothetical protein
MYKMIQVVGVVERVEMSCVDEVSNEYKGSCV